MQCIKQPCFTDVHEQPVADGCSKPPLLKSAIAIVVKVHEQDQDAGKPGKVQDILQSYFIFTGTMCHNRIFLVFTNAGGFSFTSFSSVPRIRCFLPAWTQ